MCANALLAVQKEEDRPVSDPKFVLVLILQVVDS